jgi:predicted secreted protein
MHIGQFIHLFTDGHLGCVHTLAIVNKLTMDMRVHMSLWHTDFHVSEAIPGRQIMDHVVVLF